MRMSRQAPKTFFLASLLILVPPCAEGGEIHDAVRAGDVEKVKALLKANPDLVSTQDQGGWTPLQCAVVKGSKDIAELLLVQGADVNDNNKGAGSPPLLLAATAGHQELVRLLITRGADVNARDGWKSNIAVRWMLEDLGARKLEDALCEATPLHWAAMRGDKKISQTLIENRANVSAKDKKGRTALQIAEEEGNGEAAEVLARAVAHQRQDDAASGRGMFTLRACGRPGETYNTVYEYTFTSKPVLVKPAFVDRLTQRIALRMWIETTVKEVKSNGRVLVNKRVKRISLQVLDRQNRTEFDSSEQSAQELAKQNPAVASSLKVLEAMVRCELEPNGDLRKADVVGPVGCSFLNDDDDYNIFAPTIHQPRVLLPDQPVTLFDKWESSEQSVIVAAVGRLNAKLEGTLLDVHRDGDDQIAVIGIRGKMNLNSDRDVEVKRELESTRIEGVESFSIKKGRTTLSTWVAECTIKSDHGEGGVNGIRQTVRVRRSEERP